MLSAFKREVDGYVSSVVPLVPTGSQVFWMSDVNQILSETRIISGSSVQEIMKNKPRKTSDGK